MAKTVLIYVVILANVLFNSDSTVSSNSPQPNVHISTLHNKHDNALHTIHTKIPHFINFPWTVNPKFLRDPAIGSYPHQVTILSVGCKLT